MLLQAAKQRGKHEITISVDWLAERIERGVCEVSGLPFVLQGRGRSPFSPSVDRRDNTLGYTPENTQVVVWMYNAGKGTGSDADMLTLAEALCRTHARK